MGVTYRYFVSYWYREVDGAGGADWAVIERDRPIATEKDASDLEEDLVTTYGDHTISLTGWQLMEAVTMAD